MKIGGRSGYEYFEEDIILYTPFNFSHEWQYIND